ncbi:hypothetical protein BGW37DRAFT_507988 [Umbelopsis sp. PMI_123]|nr:hypothetical protein BGW37DRAFT_507988 [Umbelopsis sp. PMI_123]
MFKYLFKPSSRRAISLSTSQLATYTLPPCLPSPTLFPYRLYKPPSTGTPKWSSTLMKPISTLMEAASILFNYPTFLITSSNTNKVVVVSHVKAMMSDYLTLRYRDMTIWTSANTIAGIHGHLLYQLETPALFCHNVDMQREFNYVQLGNDARRMLHTPNAGGTSILSEVMSMELMQRLFGAKISKTEMELVYSTSHTPITDYSCILPSVNGQPAKRIAVSVTRAMAYQRKFKPADAKRLLTKKLRGVFYSNQTLANETIERQILHIWTPSGAAANIVRKLWYKMPRELLCNTVVLVSIVNSHWIFDNSME